MLRGLQLPCLSVSACSNVVFPNSKSAMKRFVFLCSLLITSCAHAVEKQKELENLRSRIVKMQREMDQTKESKSKVLDALRESERAISHSNLKMSELETQQQFANQNLDKLQVRQKDITGNMSHQRKLLSKQLYLQYTAGNPSYIQRFLGEQEFNQLARNLEYYQYIARDRAVGITALRNNLGTLKTSQVELQAQSKVLAELNAEEIVQRHDLENEQRTKQQLLNNFSSQLKQQRREVSRLQRDEKQLAQLVDKLAKMLTQSKSSAMVDKNRVSGKHSTKPVFLQLRGKLLLPVRGVIANRFGPPRPDSTVLWKGLFVRAASGQIVKAIAAGQVVFSDWLRGFGNLLIVDHGEGYMSLYGGNETLYKQVGEFTVAGEKIATVGNSGGNEDSGLYFELRHESKPFDPIKWFAKK